MVSYLIMVYNGGKSLNLPMDFPIPSSGTMSRCAVRSTDEALQTAVVRHGVLWLPKRSVTERWRFTGKSPEIASRKERSLNGDVFASLVHEMKI